MRKKIIKNTYKPTNYIVKKENNHIISFFQDDYFNISINEISNDRIFLFLQFYVPKNKKRYEEIKYCLKKNLENVNINKIYLLNEKIYTLEELGIKDNLNKKIEQIDIQKRLTFMYFYEYIKNFDNCYCILANSDIFFDHTINNIKYGNMHKKKYLQALIRYNFFSNGNYRLFGNRSDSQDTWIVHSSQIKDLDTKNMNFLLGLGGCDNAITDRFYKQGFTILNEPDVIKTYHYHEEDYRTWNKKERISQPYLYPIPIIKRYFKNESEKEYYKKEIYR